MNERRRRFIKTAGIALVPAVAGCTEQSDRETDSNDGSTPETTATTVSPETTTTTVPPQTETETQSDAGTATPTDSDGDKSRTDTSAGTEPSASTETPASTDAVTIVITNVGIRSWEVAEDESGSVAPTGENNPTLSFEVGQRYAVENRGWSTHPFAVRDADDGPLLSQSADGRFEEDETVDWTDNGETFEFTFTEDLAAAADYYICTIHSRMRGGVDTA